MKKRKQRLSPRAQIAVAAAVPLVLIAIGWLLVVSPKRSQASDLARQVDAAETRLVQLQTEAAHAQKPQPIRVADVFRLVKAMPDTEDMPGIILQLNQVALESGVAFDSIVPDPAPPVAGTGYVTRKIQLTFAGNFYELSDFLYRLRSLVGVHRGELAATGRLFSVETLQFVEGKPSFPQIEATLTIDAYVYGTGGVAAPAPATAATAPTDSTATTTATTTTTTATTTTTTTTPEPTSTTPTAAGAPGVSD